MFITDTIYKQAYTCVHKITRFLADALCSRLYLVKEGRNCYHNKRVKYYIFCVWI